ncbi:MAG TPA: DUF1844 domain-containing protein [Bryobacteraceae bacterium]|nr:DUF1844 domain-containing protein [Bryobacteraceae bacterium]
MSDSDFPLPPPSFEFLVFSLKMQAEMRLGLLALPGQEPETDLRAARHTIDLLAMLEHKTKGNLEMEERRLLENSLTELRFRFVQVSDKAAEAKPAEAPKVNEA